MWDVGHPARLRSGESRRAAKAARRSACGRGHMVNAASLVSTGSSRALARTELLDLLPDVLSPSRSRSASCEVVAAAGGRL